MVRCYRHIGFDVVAIHGIWESMSRLDVFVLQLKLCYLRVLQLNKLVHILRTM